MPGKDYGRDKWESGLGQGAGILVTDDDQFGGRGLLRDDEPAARARPGAAAPAVEIDLGPEPERLLRDFTASRFRGIARLTKDEGGAAAVTLPHIFREEPLTPTSPLFWILRGYITPEAAEQQRRSQLQERCKEEVIRRRNALADEHYRGRVDAHYEAEPAWVKLCEREHEPAKDKELARQWRAIGPEEEAKIAALLALTLDLEPTGWGKGRFDRSLFPGPGFHDRSTDTHPGGEVGESIAVEVVQSRQELREALVRTAARDATRQVIVCGWPLNAPEAAAIEAAGAVYALPDRRALELWIAEKFPKAPHKLIV